LKNEKIFTGKNVEEALEAGLMELGLEKENVSYEVIEQEKKGILGIGAAPAKIKIIYTSKKNGEGIAVNYVKNLLDHMEIEADVKFEKGSQNRYNLSIEGDKTGVLIGHHGDTLDALQYLVNLAVNKKEEDGEKGEYMNITLDVSGYRAKREQARRVLAIRMATKVLKYKRSVTLEPMLPYERRIIHSEVQGIEGVSTNSIGVENNRKVVIFLEETGFQKSMERDNDRRNSSRGDRGDRKKSGGYASKRSSSVVLPKIEKKQLPKIEIDDYDESDYSSTAYLREPTKRFSSFAEYESHMASLAAQGEAKAAEKDKSEETAE